jgi:ribosomal protein S27AE
VINLELTEDQAKKLRKLVGEQEPTALCVYVYEELTDQIERKTGVKFCPRCGEARTADQFRGGCCGAPYVTVG